MDERTRLGKVVNMDIGYQNWVDDMLSIITPKMAIVVTKQTKFKRNKLELKCTPKEG